MQSAPQRLHTVIHRFSLACSLGSGISGSSSVPDRGASLPDMGLSSSAWASHRVLAAWDLASSRVRTSAKATEVVQAKPPMAQKSMALSLIIFVLSLKVMRLDIHFLQGSGMPTIQR